MFSSSLEMSVVQVTKLVYMVKHVMEIFLIEIIHLAFSFFSGLYHAENSLGPLFIVHSKQREKCKHARFSMAWLQREA